MSKHTKGPWVSVNGPCDDDYHCVCVVDHMTVCAKEVIGSAEDDAHLIAAAPELYDELVQADAQMQMAYECVEAGRYDEALLHLGAMSRTRRAAIAKARGEA